MTEHLTSDESAVRARDLTRERVSVVVPMYNEGGNVDAFVDEVAGVLHELPFELILVDDGSSDDTWDRIARATYEDSRIHGLKLSRNFGHQNALLAGLFHATGRVVITMDGDLQHPPTLLPQLLAKWSEGYDIVNTFRGGEAELYSGFKSYTSRMFYRLFSLLTGVELSPGSSDFRLVDRKVLDTVLRFQDVRIFFRGAFRWVGHRQTSVAYHLRARHAGRSKYGLRKMLRFAVNAIVEFSSIPLKVGIVIGFLTSALAFVELIYVIVLGLSGASVPGWASMIGLMSLLFGILFVLLGIIGLYISRIYEVLQGRPRFIVDEIAGDDHVGQVA